ncbi:hypothetical protein OAO87_00420 [bacterium]|nr:hypothetical protein [bacterium]
MDYVPVAVDDGSRNCPGWNMNPWWFNKELRQLSASVQAGEVQPLLFEGFAFEEQAVQAALRLLQRGANVGRLIVRVGRRKSLAMERPAPSLEIQSLAGRDLERGIDLGTLIHLVIDAERGTVVLQLHDPQRFNTMGWALGEDVVRAVNHLRRCGGFRSLVLQGAGSVFCAGTPRCDPNSDLAVTHSP